MPTRRDVNVQINDAIEAATARIREAHGVSRAASFRVLLERGAGRSNVEVREVSADAMRIALALQQTLTTWLGTRGEALNWDPVKLAQLPNELATLLHVK